MSGGNTYDTCPGTGRRVLRVTDRRPSPGNGRVGSDGTGICAACGRDVSQRGRVAKRHKALPVTFHRHDDLLVEFPKKHGVGGCGHHEHDGMPRHYHYVSGDRIDWRDWRGRDHSSGWVK